MNITLHLKLLSDTTFGRGDGVSGLVDQEVEHDPATGLPFVRGRTLKGLLVEECANILYAVSNDRLEEAARLLFGQGGSDLGSAGVLHIGNAELAPELRATVLSGVTTGQIQPNDVLELFTGIRRQTAFNEETGTPADKTLRASRVLLRDTKLTATVEINADNADAMALLWACTAGLRRGGTGRNRGRGRLEAWLEDDKGKVDKSGHFEKLVKGNRS